MSVFVDTSALYALLDRDDRFHSQAATAWRELIESGNRLSTSSYVILECFALVQRRLGMEAVRALADHLVPLVLTEWIGESEHRVAHAAMLSAGRRDVSLVDYTSFHLMRARSVRRAFTFDPHFSEQGFTPVPSP